MQDQETKFQARRRGWAFLQIGRVERWLGRMRQAQLPSNLTRQCQMPAFASGDGQSLNLVDRRELRRDWSNALKIRSRRFRVSSYYFSLLGGTRIKIVSWRLEADNLSSDNFRIFRVVGMQQEAAGCKAQEDAGCVRQRERLERLIRTTSSGHVRRNRGASWLTLTLNSSR